MEFKHRHVVLPGHPLLGRVIEVRAEVFTNHDATLADVRDPLAPDSIELVFDDGRTISIGPTGFDAEGLLIQP